MGRPLYVDRGGLIKLNEINSEEDEQRVIRSFLQGYEDLLKYKTLACSALYDRQITQNFSILDLKGFNLGMWNKKTIRIVKNMAKFSQDFYPEIMGKMFVCNAPKVFVGVFSLIRGWIDEKTREKITIHGTNFYQQLKRYVDED